MFGSGAYESRRVGYRLLYTSKDPLPDVLHACRTSWDRLILLLTLTNPEARRCIVNKRSIAAVSVGLLVWFVLIDMPGISAQSSGSYKVDANWAQLPGGKTWDGSTSWITADGKGNVLV